MRNEAVRGDTTLFPIKARSTLLVLLAMGVVSLLGGSRLTTRRLASPMSLAISNVFDSKVAVQTIQDTRNSESQNVTRNGVFVLGMHRSGTSMFSGLLEAHGYSTLGRTKAGSAFNAKGYFELLSLIRQNIVWKEEQCGKGDDLRLDALKCFNASRSSAPNQVAGQPTLAATRNASHAPWLLKDPRLCVTLPAWLRFMDDDPAAVFIFRHPLEVAQSYNKRRQRRILAPALVSWIVYNQLAIQNSQRLCRVVTDVETIHEDPLQELTRISSDLTQKCGVVAPRRILTQDIVDQFVDSSLRHQSVATKANATSFCTFQEHPKVKNARDKLLYKVASEMYCDFKSGKAFESDYKWPSALLLETPPLEKIVA